MRYGPGDDVEEGSFETFTRVAYWEEVEMVASGDLLAFKKAPISTSCSSSWRGGGGGGCKDPGTDADTTD